MTVVAAATVKVPTVAVPVAATAIEGGAQGRFAGVVIRKRRSGDHGLGSNEWFTPSHDGNHRVCSTKQHGLAGDLLRTIGRLEIKLHVGDHRGRFGKIHLLHKRRQIIGPNEQQEGLPDDQFGVDVQNDLTGWRRV